jgi:hypothetical protein
MLPASLRLTTLLSGCFLLVAVLTISGADPQHAHQLLKGLGMSTGELRSLDLGRPVVKSLKSEDRREIAAAGAIKVAVPVEFLVDRFRDIVAFKKSPIVRQIGKFSDVPRLQELAGLTLESSDIDALRRCRVADCGINLSADDIRRIEAEIEWSGPAARAQATRLFHHLLFDHVQSYRGAGAKSPLEYRNEKEPVMLAEEFRSLVEHSGQLLTGVPEFRAHLLSGQPLRDSENFIYWSKEQFGLKPVVSMTHVIIYRPGRADAPDVVIASKQIYASRYLSGSLALTLGIDTTTPGSAPSFYMAYGNRTRPRAYPPLVGGLVRRIAQSETRSGLDENLRLIKERLERDYSALSPQ